MERFYGRDHSVGLTNEEVEQCIALWRGLAAEHAVSAEQRTLVEWFDERLHRRSTGSRAFRIAPAPEPISGRDTLDFFAWILREHARTLAVADDRASRGGRGRAAWLGALLDLHAFVNQARGEDVDFEAPTVSEADANDVYLHRMWDRFIEAARMENHVFPDDPRYPDPERLLRYLDSMLVLAEREGREERRAWPFPKILWEREILLEKLGRYDEMAETMRRSAALEDESFRQQTEEYIASLAS